MAPVALVTGASSGLGEEFARQLSAQGYRLILTARRGDRLDRLAREIGHARTVPLDLAAPGAAARLVADLEAAGDRLDLLVNNAGFGLVGRFGAMDAEQLRRMVDLNCGALVELCRAFAPAMAARGSGAILNVASTAAFQPGPGMAVYFATKAMVLSFTEALHEEMRGTGVKVCALCPGPTATEFGQVAGFSSTGASAKLAMSASPVVAAGLKGLHDGRAIVIPGVANRIGAQAHRLLPRAWLRRAAGLLKL